jgi:hypothetical protein
MTNMKGGPTGAQKPAQEEAGDEAATGVIEMLHLVRACVDTVPEATWKCVLRTSRADSRA